MGTIFFGTGEGLKTPVVPLAEETKEKAAEKPTEAYRKKPLKEED